MGFCARAVERVQKGSDRIEEVSAKGGLARYALVIADERECASFLSGMV